jgi:glycosyltransferase involved in cell wall biosynthesis
LTKTLCLGDSVAKQLPYFKDKSILNQKMKILLIEPYFTGSHAAWAKGYQAFSRHEIDLLSLTGQFWKWRMHGGAVTLAEQFQKMKFKPDQILATDMLDLTTFLSLTRNITHQIPSAFYFHENQLCYPWSPDDRDVIQKRDRHYGFINYTSALAADAVFFNSQFHLNVFFEELPKMLKHFPDHRGLTNVDKIFKKSQVLPLGLDLKKFDQYRPNKKQTGQKPMILWNHRWEYDKNPEDFFNALYAILDLGIEFEVTILGENFSNYPKEFEEAQEKLGNRIVHFGYTDSFEKYAHLLWQADIIPVTSNQDFFGASTVEAIYCGCYPLLPNRLAFPEIIQIDKHQENFYDDFEELVNKLGTAVRQIESSKQQTNCFDVDKYCWENMIDHYDQLFEEMI